MAKTLDYQITLYPAHRDGAFVVTQFQMMANYPEKRIQAAGMDDLIDKVTQFAMEHGESCSASVRCHTTTSRHCRIPLLSSNGGSVTGVRAATVAPSRRAQQRAVGCR